MNRTITKDMALNAYPHLRSASDAALLSFHLKSVFFGDQLQRHFEQAAAALGYTLIPIPQPAQANTGVRHEVASTPTRDPDSGRASSELGAPDTALPALHHNYGG